MHDMEKPKNYTLYARNFPMKGQLDQIEAEPRTEALGDLRAIS